MPLYNFQNSALKLIKENPFKLEKEIQNIFERNLTDIAGIEFVCSEFAIKNRRIDTLAFNKETKSFVIIEYKRKESFSVIDQGFAYLGLMLENKAEFIVEYNEKMKSRLTRNEVDWSQSKVFFVSNFFNENQIQATNFKDIAIELWEIKRFANNNVLISNIKKSSSSVSVKPIIERNSKMKAVSDEIYTPTEEDHLNNKPENTKQLYEDYKQAILNLYDGIEVKPKKQEIGFFHNGKVFCDICIQKSSIKLWINLKKGLLNDPKKIMRDISSIGHWGNGDYEVQVQTTENLEYIMSLIKQAIEKTI